MTYYIYIIECTDTTLYTGVTTDINKRLCEHKNKTGAKYTRSHPPAELKALWTCEGRSAAQKLEYAIKQLSRENKLSLILNNNYFEKYFTELDTSLYNRTEKAV